MTAPLLFGDHDDGHVRADDSGYHRDVWADYLEDRETARRDVLLLRAGLTERGKANIGRAENEAITRGADAPAASIAPRPRSVSPDKEAA